MTVQTSQFHTDKQSGREVGAEGTNCPGPQGLRGALGRNSSNFPELAPRPSALFFLLASVAGGLLFLFFATLYAFNAALRVTAIQCVGTDLLQEIS